MKNDSLGFNIPSSNQEDMQNSVKASEFDVQQKNNEIFPKNFDADLNISNIINTDNNELIKNKKNQIILNTDKSFEESLENFSKINLENEHLEENLNLEESEIQSEIVPTETKEINEDKKKSKKKRTKEDLNNTPLPVFECLYCTNEKIVFSHFINEILSEKYLLQTSIYDMKDLNKLILNKRLISYNKSEKLLNIIMDNTEYMKIYFPKKEINTYFKSDNFYKLCIKGETDLNRLFKHKIEDSIVRKKKDFYFKGINKIPKNSMNNKGLFNSTNSLINNFNALSGLVEPVQATNVNNNIKNNFTIGTCSNNSINFNSLSLNNNEFNCYYKDNNNNMLDYIVEKIEKNEESVNYVDDKDLIIDFFKFDLSRKINKKDIKWENKIYNVYNPEISSDFDDNYDDDENYYSNVNKITNDTKNKSINMNINNLNSRGIPINKNLSNNSIGFIKYHKNKGKNLIFTFNKEKNKSKANKKNTNNIQDKPNNTNNKSNINSHISNDNTSNTNSNIFIKPLNENNQINITKDSSEKIQINSNITNKSVSINNININMNKSQNVNKKIPKQKDHISNQNTILNNKKNILSSVFFLKNFNSIVNNNSNINKSVNILGKSKKKINYSIQNINKKNKSKNKSNIKSLQYMSNSKKSNDSTNYSIGISINLKSNSSIKSNGFLQYLKYENSLGNAYRIFNENKSINGIKFNERKKSSKNLIKKNKLFNLFNNLNLVNFKEKHNRAKSNYKYNNQKKEKKIPRSSKSISLYKNQNRKNNYNIYKKNKMCKQKLFNFSSDRQKKVIIPRSNGPLFSSNSKQMNNNLDNFYSNSLGLSIGSNDNNYSETYSHIQFNSISNLNKSNSNINNSKINSNSKNNSKNLFSPNKFNKTFYNNNNHNKEIKKKLNDLLLLVNHCKNKNYDNNYKNNINDFKNKSINLINSKSYIKKQGYKSTKRFMFK